MKISKEFVLREIAGDYVIVPTGEAAFRFQGLITVNDTGAFLWNKLQEGEKTEDDLTDALCNEYETDRTEAAEMWLSSFGHYENIIFWQRSDERYNKRKRKRWER